MNILIKFIFDFLLSFWLRVKFISSLRASEQLLASRFVHQLFIFLRISRSSGHNASHVAFKFDPIEFHVASKIEQIAFAIV